MKKHPALLIVLVILGNFAFAADTDAEILKDLDFFADFDMVREDAVIEEDIPFDEAPSEAKITNRSTPSSLPTGDSL